LKKPTEMFEMYGEEAMPRAHVSEWCKWVSKGKNEIKFDS
jgi:hypothetical protein